MVRSTGLVAVLALLSAMLVTVGGPTGRAVAAEPTTVTYESQVNVWSDIYQLSAGVLAVDVGTPTIVWHHTSTGWVEVFRTAKETPTRLTGTDVVLVGSAAIDGRGTVHQLPVDWSAVSPFGWLSASGVYTKWADGATTQLTPGSGGSLTTDGRYLVRTESDQLIRHDLATGERVVLHATDPSAFLMAPVVGGGGRIWWWVRGTSPSRICSVPIDGPAEATPDCTVATPALEACLLPSRTALSVQQMMLRQTDEGAYCVRALAGREYEIIGLADHRGVTVTFPDTATVQRRQVALVSGTSFVVAGSDGTVRTAEADPATGRLTTTAMIDRMKPAPVYRVVVDGDTIYTTYSTPETWDDMVVWERRIGETSAEQGALVARGSKFVASLGRFAYYSRLAEAEATTVDVDGTQSTLPWEVHSMSGWYLKVGSSEQVVTFDGRASKGVQAYDAYEGSRHLIGTTLVDKDRRVPDVAVPASIGTVRAIRGPWVQGDIAAWNTVTGRQVAGYGSLGEGFRVATDGMWIDLASGAAARWLPAGQTATIAGVTGRTVVWLDSAGQVRSTTIPDAPLPGPRLLNSLDPSGPNSIEHGDLNLSTTTPWTLRVDVNKGVAAGSLEIWDGSTLIRSFPTPASPTGAMGVFSWDGKNAQGIPVIGGLYQWRLLAVAVDGSGLVTQADGTGQASGVIAVRHSPVDPPIWQYYHGGSVGQQERAALGQQVEQTKCGLPDNGCQIVFANGTVTWTTSSPGAVVIGDIRRLWNQYGGMTGRLGVPSNKEVCQTRLGGYGCLQDFSGAMIGWTASQGAHPVWGEIGRRYRSSYGWAGYPTTDENCGLIRSGCYQIFTGSHIHWSPASGAHVTLGAIRGSWGSYGWERSRIGYPTSEETCDLINDNRTCVQTFEGARYVWTQSNGAHPVWGAIRDRYRAMGGETGIQWTYPLTDEQCGLVRGGCYQIFNGFHIHWSQQTGAHSTSGAIRDKWASQGWERGRLGYPTSEPIAQPDNAGIQYFEGGLIRVDRQGRASITYY